MPTNKVLRKRIVRYKLTITFYTFYSVPETTKIYQISCWPAGVQHVGHEGDRIHTSRRVHHINDHTGKRRGLEKKPYVYIQNVCNKETHSNYIMMTKRERQWSTRASVIIVPDADHVNTSICPGVSIKTCLHTKKTYMR